MESVRWTFSQLTFLCKNLRKEGGSRNMFEWNYNKEILCFLDIPTAWTSSLSGQARESFSVLLTPPWRRVCVEDVMSNLAWQRVVWLGVGGRSHWLWLHWGKRKPWEQVGDVRVDLKWKGLGDQRVRDFTAHRLGEGLWLSHATIPTRVSAHSAPGLHQQPWS